MRPTLLALVVVLLVGSYACHDAAAESGSRWWPFGGSDTDESPPAMPPSSDPLEESAVVGPSQVEQSPSQSEVPANEEPEQRWMIDSPLAKVSWPRLQLPDMPQPQLPKAQLWPQKSEVEADRNAWAEDDVTPTQPSPWQAMTNGARRVGDRTRAAWDKTIDVLTPGSDSGSPSSRVARREDRQPWWKRMFAVEDREPQGPQTVTEWMAQERLDP
jgi:hypothetical protein